MKHVTTPFIALLLMAGCDEQQNKEPLPSPGSHRPLEGLAEYPADLSVPQWVGQRTDEPFDVRKFLESRTPPADNAAPLYLAALADISTNMESVYTPDEWQARLPDVQDLETRINDLSNEDKLGSGSVSLEDIERLLADLQAVVQKLDEAQEKSACVFVMELGPPQSTPTHLPRGRLPDWQKSNSITHISPASSMKPNRRSVAHCVSRAICALAGISLSNLFLS